MHASEAVDIISLALDNAANWFQSRGEEMLHQKTCFLQTLEPASGDKSVSDEFVRLHWDLVADWLLTGCEDHHGYFKLRFFYLGTKQALQVLK